MYYDSATGLHYDPNTQVKWPIMSAALECSLVAKHGTKHVHTLCVCTWSLISIMSVCALTSTVPFWINVAIMHGNMVCALSTHFHNSFLGYTPLAQEVLWFMGGYWLFMNLGGLLHLTTHVFICTLWLCECSIIITGRRACIVTMIPLSKHTSLWTSKGKQAHTYIDVVHTYCSHLSPVIH